MDQKFTRITEQPSLYDHLEQKTTAELLASINAEDRKVAQAVASCLPQIELLVEALVERFPQGRLFYIGAGTSGRLGVLDASEIPPTYGMPHDRVIGIIAGGDGAIRRAVEGAEDDRAQAWLDLQAFDINVHDVVVGIAASGTTPYVLGGIEACRANGILTAGITNNPGAPLALTADIGIACNVGPEFVTGSTRMKSGTSQKLILNMISTAYMIRIGRVEGHKMVHMQLTNEKLVGRGTSYIEQALGIETEEALRLLKTYGSVARAVEAYRSKG